MIKKYALFISDLQTKVLPRIINSTMIVRNVNLLLESQKHIPTIQNVYMAQLKPAKLGPILPQFIQNNNSNNYNIITKDKYSMFSNEIHKSLTSVLLWQGIIIDKIGSCCIKFKKLNIIVH